MVWGFGGARVGLFNGALWRQRREIATMTGLRPARRFRSAAGLVAVAGWGRKQTAARARAAAARAGVPYWSLEDGFFRSLAPGAAEPTLSYILDRAGIYYDASAPSDLERLVAARAADPDGAARDAAPALEALRTGLSKYNLFAPAAAAEAALAKLHPDPARNVLVADQTLGDASVAGALAGTGRTGPETFRAMLAAAAAENPDARLVLKVHPETRMGRRAGHLDPGLLATAAAASPAFAEAQAAGRVILVSEAVRPRDLFARTGRAYILSSLIGFEALAAGLPVAVFGRAFYAGWGLTDDRAPPVPGRAPASLDALAAAAYADYCRWFHPQTRRPIPLAEAADLLLARAGLRAA